MYSLRSDVRADVVCDAICDEVCDEVCDAIDPSIDRNIHPLVWCVLYRLWDRIHDRKSIRTPDGNSRRKVDGVFLEKKLCEVYKGKNNKPKMTTLETTSEADPKEPPKEASEEHKTPTLLRSILANIAIFVFFWLDLVVGIRCWSTIRWILFFGFLSVCILKLCLLDLANPFLYRTVHRLTYMWYPIVAPLLAIVSPFDQQTRLFECRPSADRSLTADSVKDRRIMYGNILSGISFIAPNWVTDKRNATLVSETDYSTWYRMDWEVLLGAHYEGHPGVKISEQLEPFLKSSHLIDVDRWSFFYGKTKDQLINAVIAIPPPDSAQSRSEHPIVCCRATNVTKLTSDLNENGISFFDLPTDTIFRTLNDVIVDASAYSDSDSIGIHSGVLETWKGYKRLILDLPRNIFDPTREFDVSGHSLGGALAQLCKLDKDVNFNVRNMDICGSFNPITNWAWCCPTFEESRRTNTSCRQNIFDPAVRFPVFPYVAPFEVTACTDVYSRVNKEFMFPCTATMYTSVLAWFPMIATILDFNTNSFSYYHSSTIGYCPTEQIPFRVPIPNWNIERYLAVAYMLWRIYSADTISRNVAIIGVIGYVLTDVMCGDPNGDLVSNIGDAIGAVDRQMIPLVLLFVLFILFGSVVGVNTPSVWFILTYAVAVVIDRFQQSRIGPIC